MKSLLNVLFLLSTIALLISNINARSIIGDLTNSSKNSGNSDDYYVIFINNSLLTSKETAKRENRYIFTSLISEIHDLIVDNKDTFVNIEKFNKINEREPNSIKKEIEEKYLMKEGDSNIVFPISSLKDKTILRVYVSPKLVKEIRSMDYVIDCIPYLNYVNSKYSN
ncbi:hypothetical protein H8356DRAFT_1649159 [Neocallimastix lanati (nom. inval.)]|uniref:Uncharacterized protein n=1 Tax=Neocallimastix californiae TaxID=1754190 RepID=A0A1Y1XS90_9FUNG|nr:hypothetical protein H8356DRAFT_1649159 [Neocallimastix sp. JGI-2020a]ORX88598.1 hypothetical protein LY90DRAFT_710156 [Neocallimastix californiae]|eukprot:ORX88598.1 hypothetical protein LY90DRAFT_710156 [Neocallimastix californiae]